jgi:hypothetical protein
MYRGYMLPVGICKFCGQKKELINSHIIPKCFYQIKTMGSMSRINSKTQQIDYKNHQNGLKEPLLCKECDNQLGILDEYANKVLFYIIPKHEFKVITESVKEYLLEVSDFDYDKLRRFFISLVWRTSICKTEPFPLGKYEEIALKILKNEISDNEELFLPLIYRKSTNTPVDCITGLFSYKFLGKHACRFRFPNYEIVVIINTKNSNDENIMNLLRQMFSRNKIKVIEIMKKTPLDYKLISEMVKIQKTIKHK